MSHRILLTEHGARSQPLAEGKGDPPRQIVVGGIRRLYRCAVGIDRCKALDKSAQVLAQICEWTALLGQFELDTPHLAGLIALAYHIALCRDLLNCRSLLARQGSQIAAVDRGAVILHVG